MPCKQCASSRQQDFQGELTVAFTGKERIDLSPVYVCQETWVCLDCGYTELVVPACGFSRSFTQGFSPSFTHPRVSF